MAGGDKKWDVSAERDLCVAIIVGNSSEDKVRHNWPNIHSFMSQLGYTFTKDAISQHFTKVIMKDFKTRHGNYNGTPVSTPGKPAAKKPAASKRTPSKRAKADSEGEEDSEDAPLAKKSKLKAEKPVKSETVGPRKRERSATVYANDDDEYNAWISGDAPNAQ